MAKKATKVKEEEKKTEVAPWLLGTGIDADMTGEGSGKSAATSNSNRFWMPKGSDRTIIFLSDGQGDYGPATSFEHQVQLHGNWRNWFTCLESTGKACPLCEWNKEHNQFKRYKAMFFSIIDTTEFVDKRGNKRKNLKKILCAKRGVAEIIKRKYLARFEEGEGIRGAMFKVYRTNDDKSSSVGEDYEFVKMVDLSGLEDSEPHDWAEVLRPESLDTCVEQLRRERGLDTDDDDGTESFVDF
jgi:hypothetical protein